MARTDCDPALSVLVMLVSRKIFHVASALQSIVCHNIFWLIRSQGAEESYLTVFLVKFTVQL